MKQNAITTSPRDSSLDVLAFTKTWGQRRDKRFKTCRLFRKDPVDDKIGGGIAIQVKYAVLAVPHHLRNIQHNDASVCDSGLPNSPLTLICIFYTLGENVQVDAPLLMLMRTLIDDSHRFVLVVDLNSGLED